MVVAHLARAESTRLLRGRRGHEYKTVINPQSAEGSACGQARRYNNSQRRHAGHVYSSSGVDVDVVVLNG